MSPYELFLIAVRWTPAAATVGWIGGGLFYLLVLGPATQGQRRGPWRQISPAAGAAFAELTQLAMFMLIAGGAILALDRLTGAVASTPYVVVLGAKVVLPVWAFLSLGA